MTGNEEFPEAPGHFNIPGFVKGNPANNENYLSQCCEVYPEWETLLRDTHEKIKALDPGYNISQIKDKFGGLRYYVTLTKGLDHDTQDTIADIINLAENNSYTDDGETNV